MNRHRRQINTATDRLNTLYADLPPPPASLHRRMLKLEGWLGAFWATLIALGLAGLLTTLGQVVPNPKWWEVAIAVVVALLWLCLELPFLWRVWSSVYHGHVPLALYVAARQPLRPLPLRPIVAFWWLGHFVLGMLGAYFTETRMVPSASEEDLPIAMAVGLLMVFLYSFAANIYLASAIAALTRSPIVDRIWRLRGAFDIALTVIATAVLLQKLR